MEILALGDDRSLDTLNQETQDLVEQVQTTKRPLVITRNGQSAAVLMDAEAYEQQQRQFVLMQRIARGKQEVTAGKTRTQEEVEALLDEWLPENALTPA